MKKLISLLLVLSLVMVALAGCGSSTASDDKDSNKQGSEEKVYNLKMALAAAKTSAAGKTGLKIKEDLEAKSNGRIKVAFFPDAQLGGDLEMTQGVQAGDIDIAIQSTAPQVSFVPEAAVFDMPATLTDIDATLAMLQKSSFRDKMNEKYAKAGFKLATMYPTGFREMSSNKAVRSYADFDGVKIRTMENPYHVAYWNSLGANPTPLNFSELYLALDQGTVHAQENPLQVILSSKFNEVQDYLIFTDHIMFINSVIMNEKKFESMPEDLQKIVDEVMADAATFGKDKAVEDDQKSLKTIQDSGDMEIIRLSEDDRAKMTEAAEPVYDMIKEKIGSELVDSLLNSYQEALNK